ncbi:MAG: helix-turn-helix transcriptional regulator [Bacillota bacterium]
MNLFALTLKMKQMEISVSALSKLTGIGKQSLYNKMNGKTAFTQGDIVKLVDVLHLDREAIRFIFFADEVS